MQPFQGRKRGNTVRFPWVREYATHGSVVQRLRRKNGPPPRELIVCLFLSRQRRAVPAAPPLPSPRRVRRSRQRRSTSLQGASSPASALPRTGRRTSAWASRSRSRPSCCAARVNGRPAIVVHSSDHARPGAGADAQHRNRRPHADRASAASTWASTRSAPGRSALWMTITSATSSRPAFSHCRSSPVSGCSSSTTTSARSRTDRVALAGADRLDQHHVEAERLQQPDQGVEVFGHGAVSAGRGEAADEDAVIVGPRRHAEAVAQQGAAAQRTLRIAGQHGDGLAVARESVRSACRPACSCRRRRCR